MKYALGVSISHLERIQKFALKIAYKSWDNSYETLLLRSGLQQLSERTTYLRLCYLFQIINGNFVFKLERACPVLNQIMMELQSLKQTT